MKSLICDKCGYEFAHFEGKPGHQKLVVKSPEIAITVISKDPLLGEIECPKCHHHTKIVAEWMKRF